MQNPDHGLPLNPCSKYGRGEHESGYWTSRSVRRLGSLKIPTKGTSSAAEFPGSMQKLKADDLIYLAQWFGINDAPRWRLGDSSPRFSGLCGR